MHSGSQSRSEGLGDLKTSLEASAGTTGRETLWRSIETQDRRC